MYKIYFTLTAIMLILFGCEVEETISNNSLSTEAVYTGSTYRLSEWSNSIDGPNQSDTTFNDTVFVNLVSIDSVLFKHGNYEYKFRLDTSNNYIQWLGIYSNKSFHFKTSDSLLAEFYGYGGAGDGINYSATIETFCGAVE